MTKYYISNSKISNQGVFSKKDIKKGEIIFILKGVLHKCRITTKKEAMKNPNMMGVGENTWIHPTSPGVFINHSCDPNAGIKGSVTFVALKNIKKNEEITFDYSISEDSPWEMKCNCGSLNCRRIIRGIKFLPKDVYLKYLPNIPQYFQKVYKKYNNL